LKPFYNADKVLAVKNHKSTIEDVESNEVAQEPIYNKNEVNGKFKITSEHWDENLDDPNSVEYRKMSETVTRGIEELLEKQGLAEKASFNVTILGFK
jgi:hypothetical protein